MHSPRTHNSFLSVLLLQLRIPTVVTFGLCVYPLFTEISYFKSGRHNGHVLKFLYVYYDIKKQIHIGEKNAFHTTFLTDVAIFL